MRLSRSALLAAILVAPSFAAGQAPTDTTRDSARVRLQTVTVTGARVATVVGGASAVVVGTEQLRASPAPLLEQALRESPFVHVRQNSRGEMELSVRGSDSRQPAVLLDGMPLTLGWDHRTDPSLIPMTGTRSITIVRGLGSLLNGPNTLGGTIEVEHGVGVANDAWVGAGIDEYGAVVSTLGGERMLRSSLAVRGGLAYRKRDGFGLPDDATDPTATDGLRTNSDLTHLDGFGSVHWSGGSGRSVGLNVTGFDAERGVPPEEHIAGPRYWRYPYHSRFVVALSGSSGAVTTPLGTGSLDATAGVNSGATKIDIYGDRTYSNVTGNEIGNERNLVGRVRGSHSLGRGIVRAAVTSSTIDYRESLSGFVANYQQNLLSAGAEVEMPVLATTTFAGGVVYDRSSTPETGGRTPGQPSFDNIGWRVGASHHIGSSLQLHANGSQRSRFPALRELYSGAANRFLPNPDLKPETLLGVEGGFTWSDDVGSRGRFVAEVTGFSHDLQDAVVRITVPNPAPPPSSLFQRVNRDNIVSSGVELLAGYTLGAGDRAVSLSGDALLQRISIKDQTAGGGGRHAENNPERRGSLELGVPLPVAFRGVVTTRYMGRQYCVNADTGNEDTLDAKAETDLAVERRFSLRRSPFQALRAMVAMDNVANATVFDQCGLVQPGRTLRVMFVLR